MEVLSRFPPLPSPVSLLYPHNRQMSPRVRVFIDWLAELFKPASTSSSQHYDQ
ncbi:hypothetical protein K1W68_15790 [Novacetimonas hansenii]|uniref:LysR substrate-binding domain-containing protein n=1 Tax=Novacetimonas hansenii TaxID=436 RepID=A0AAW5EUC4_NOVHA|nr:hypothetical protein [Novacetimonas hansenii]